MIWLILNFLPIYIRVGLVVHYNCSLLIRNSNISRSDSYCIIQRTRTLTYYATSSPGVVFISPNISHLKISCLIYASDVGSFNGDKWTSSVWFLSSLGRYSQCIRWIVLWRCLILCEFIYMIMIDQVTTC